MDPGPADRLRVDLDVAADGRHARFVVAPSPRPDGAMYGGAGIAAAVMAIEAAADRPVLWATTQFVKAPTSGQTVHLEVVVLADGGRTAQLSVTATADGEVAFITLGSAGLARPSGLHGQYAAMPCVSDTDRGPWAGNSPWGDRSPVHYTEAELLGDHTFGHVALWAGRRDGAPFTAAALAYVADMVPVAVARAAGRLGAGASLDNSLRFGDIGAHDRVLLELAGDFAHGGYGHGSLRVWAPDGTLLATGGQTTNMKYLFDQADLPDLMERFSASQTAR